MGTKNPSQLRCAEQLRWPGVSRACRSPTADAWRYGPSTAEDSVTVCTRTAQPKNRRITAYQPWAKAVDCTMLRSLVCEFVCANGNVHMHVYARVHAREHALKHHGFDFRTCSNIRWKSNTNAGVRIKPAAAVTNAGSFVTVSGPFLSFFFTTLVGLNNRERASKLGSSTSAHKVHKFCLYGSPRHIARAHNCRCELILNTLHH